ncbi:hypothetical protein MGYG_08802 [Nannizzia gypsea CBS 118893]|uniref:Uncharacterized protein n=1 Tax=Arthroderma gypseum (strain ATCC MYA-4604 / CBS 118893) TaxID=535722 RepID=E4V713_ARTGP|nr:hypothetical protein MGYG_08802 [Nannizzia gypsea CBS 118893]EFQ96879.1 hypothetical protein MGYG_08802 [Nannizzia gypsea CBS 118893]
MAIITSVGRIAILTLLAFGKITQASPVPFEIRGDVIISIPSGSHSLSSRSNTNIVSGAPETKAPIKVNNPDRVDRVPQLHHNRVPPVTERRAIIPDPMWLSFEKAVNRIRGYIGARPAREQGDPTAVKVGKLHGKPHGKRGDKTTHRTSTPGMPQVSVDHITPIPGGPWKHREEGKVREPAKHRTEVDIIW